MSVKWSMTAIHVSSLYTTEQCQWTHNTVISPGHNRGTEPSNAGGHGLGEDKVAIKTDWGAVQPRKIERKKDRGKKKQDMGETWVRGLFQTQCSHFIRKLFHSPISFCLTHTKPPRHTLHPLHHTEREKCPHLNVKLMFRDKTTWFLNLLTLPRIAFLWTRCCKQKTFCSEQSKKKNLQFQQCIMDSKMKIGYFLSFIRCFKLLFVCWSKSTK